MSMEYKLPFTAKEVEERLSQFNFDGASNTLNVSAHRINFGDAVSVGKIVGDIRVVDAPSEPLHFDFICDGVKYAGIEKASEYNEYVGTVEILYYLKNDGSRETAYDFFAGYRYLSDLIQPVNMTAFFEIYNDNQECFNVDMTHGVRIGNTIVTEENATGLEVIGSYSMMSCEEFEQRMWGAYTDAPNGETRRMCDKARFIGIDNRVYTFDVTDSKVSYAAINVVVPRTESPTVYLPFSDMDPHTFTFYR